MFNIDQNRRPSQRQIWRFLWGKMSKKEVKTEQKRKNNC
jgi:hypothetical protein